ncbi:MAG: class I SAM-dependent rRNA methyltransferase, partial [Bacteroidales bacterium]|nr:class I SAM-dependent rRNA methyltransferase [Bacteroidales bacterium]
MMEQKPTLTLKPGKEKSLLRRHPWVFSGAVQRISGNPQNGDVVSICDCNGHILATGHFQDSSIMVKVLVFGKTTIDKTFWQSRLASAVDYRRRMGFFDNADTNVFRLVNA